MKVSVSKFYKSVTGSVTAGRVTTVPALKRWGVPFDESVLSERGGEAVDIAYLPKAQEAYAAEKALAAERLAERRAKNYPSDAVRNNKEYRENAALFNNTKALQDLTAAIMLLVEKSQ